LEYCSAIDVDDKNKKTEKECIEIPDDEDKKKECNDEQEKVK